MQYFLTLIKEIPAKFWAEFLVFKFLESSTCVPSFLQESHLFPSLLLSDALEAEEEADIADVVGLLLPLSPGTSTIFNFLPPPPLRSLHTERPS